MLSQCQTGAKYVRVDGRVLIFDLVTTSYQEDVEISSRCTVYIVYNLARVQKSGQSVITCFQRLR